MNPISRDHSPRLFRFCILWFTFTLGRLVSSNLVYAQTLATALDAPQLTWVTSASLPWVGQTNVTHDGVDAARSGVIGDNQESWMQTTVTGPGTLVFWWKVSSESGFDYLEFRINDIPNESIAGEVNWQQRTFNLDAGSHTLRWRYSKDFVDGAGQDRGWVDMVSYLTPTGPPVIGTHPQGRAAVSGSSVTLSVVAGGAPPLAHQWFNNATALSGQTNSSFNISAVQTNDAASYSVVVTNTLGSVTSAPAVLTVTASMLDGTFNPGANAEVDAMAVQVDEKILVGGNFTTLGGRACSRLGRLNPDGSLDTTFNAEVNGVVRSLVIQTDGRIVVGGDFSVLSGASRSSIGRLNSDGTIDDTFDPGVFGFGSVNAVLVQPDGKILVGGDFGLSRLNADGTPDNAFVSPNVGGEVFSLARQQSNGAILVGGSFIIEVVDGDGDLIAYFDLVRLNSNGSIDENYYPDPNGGVSCIVLQADGQALVSGGFSTFNGSSQPRDRIARINSNGDLVTSFVPQADGDINSIAIQTDGKIVLGGTFSTLNGQPRGGIARLNSSGTLDLAFNAGVDGVPTSLMIQSDGKILVGGSFSAGDGQPRSNVARLNNTATATQTLSYSSSTITWLRSGTGPEVGATIFEHSNDGTNWTSLGGGTRISGGWQRTGVTIPAGRTLRARGRVTAGYQNNSSGFAQKFYGRPLLLSQPTSLTNAAGTAASFTAEARGSDPLTYYWHRNGVRLTNQGNITGATNATLQLASVANSNGGSYRLVVSNSLGSVTSVVATLTVLDPFISEHPAGANRNPNQSVSFTVSALGTPVLNYQWYHEGGPIPGAIGSSLTLQTLTAADAGLYTVVVSNPSGSVTSAPALLTVNLAALEAAFDPGVGGFGVPGVFSLAVQADNKVLVGGVFPSLGGQLRNNLGRLNADGTLDSTFTPGAIGGSFPGVSCLAVQSDGNILVGGVFTFLGGQSRNNLGRLNSNGTPDATFNPGVSGGLFPAVYCLAVQSDGKILVGGSFTTLGGQSRNNLGRLNTNGTIDATFNPGANGGEVYCLAVQPDGKILVGGNFTNLAGQPWLSVGRLNPNGTLDATFVLQTDNDVYTLALQADGKILAGGAFFDLFGQPNGFLARFSTNGIMDLAPNMAADGPVSCLAVQADGKILVGGGFNVLEGQPRSVIARLNSDGKLDNTFGPSVGGGSLPTVNFIALQSDGKIVAGGDFNSVDGQTRNRLARLNNTQSAIQSLSYTGNTITWARGGSSPEIWRGSFEHSADGSTWTMLGSATRAIGGWQLTGVSLPSNGKIRARGHVVGGGIGGWFVETILDLNPAIRLNLNRSGSTVVLSWTGGQPPYQVQQTTDLSDFDSWQNLGAPSMTNLMTLPIGAGNQFWRVRSQ